MARVLASSLGKDPSLRETYPALKHIRQPTDPELHFRAWYRGGTNLLYLCFCAERAHRIFHVISERERFRQVRLELEVTIASRLENMAAGQTKPSVLAEPLKLRWPREPSPESSDGSVPSLEDDLEELLVIEGVEEQLHEEEVPHEVIVAEDATGFHHHPPGNVDAEQEDGPVVEHIEGEAAVEHTADAEQGHNGHTEVNNNHGPKSPGNNSVSSESSEGSENDGRHFEWVVHF